MAWTATFRSNPTDPNPVTFVWDDGEMICSEDSILAALERVAAHTREVGATATGPFFPADLSIGPVAFSLVMRFARLAGLDESDVEIVGDGWRWPETAAAEPGLVY